MDFMPFKDREKANAATRRHYYANKAVYLDRNKRHRQEKSNYIQQLREQPCTDCGQTYPWYVMEFDHRSDKKFTIAGMRSQTWKLIHAEVAKCDLVCANCHKVRTYERRISNTCASGGKADTPG